MQLLSLHGLSTDHRLTRIAVGAAVTAERVLIRRRSIWTTGPFAACRAYKLDVSLRRHIIFHTLKPPHQTQCMLEHRECCRIRSRMQPQSLRCGAGRVVTRLWHTSAGYAVQPQRCKHDCQP